MSRVECSVCCEEVSPSKAVVCHCDYASCVECIKRYLLSSTREAHCMMCKAEWSRSFLLNNLPKTWINGTKEGGYRYHRKVVAMDLERARIPETMPEVELDIKNEVVDTEIKEIEREKRKLRKRLAELNGRIRELNGRRYHPVDDDELPAKQKSYDFLCPCPQEECRGLVWAGTYKCTVCTNYICRRCREPKTLVRTKMKGEKEVNVFARHECNEDTVKNLTLIRKDTKPCPKCAVPIHRISGCPQMWCPMCKVAFDWNTGREEVGTIHNPHALEWLRRNGGAQRQIGDVPCGGFPQVHNLNLSGVTEKTRLEINTIHRNVQHLNYEIASLRNYRPEVKLREARKEYIRGKITEEAWKNKIYRIMSHQEKNRAKEQIIETFRDLAIDAFRELQLSKKKTRVREFLNRMEKLRLFINETIERELPLYGITVGKLLYEKTMESVGHRIRNKETEERNHRIRYGEQANRIPIIRDEAVWVDLDEEDY